MEKKKDSILEIVQSDTPLSYETVKQLYQITGSYGAILQINDIAMRYNKEVIGLARYLMDK